MRRVIVGTAGHVDHGKTKLVEAITGVDCDRWEEEKRRGITIDLGFAHLVQEDLQVGFVDVPGHERFLHNALAGLGGVRIMLLVVAADEGVKPQTHEHIAICDLLSIPSAIVALTKTDLVSDDLLDLAESEVRELLADTTFRDASVLRVSARTGEGVGELVAALLAEGAKTARPSEEATLTRFPIDRAFGLKGLGVVVTGSLVRGQVRKGDAMALRPGSATGRVRNVQVHGETREAGEVGERIAIQLAGLQLEEIERGMELTSPTQFRATRVLCAELDLLADAPGPIDSSIRVRLHSYASEVVARVRPLVGEIEPGSRGLVEVRLAAPVVAVRGDRFIIRRLSPAETLGGGVVLDPLWARRQPTDVEQAAVSLTTDEEAAVAWWVGETGEAGLDSRSVELRLGATAAESLALLQKLVEKGAAVQVRVPSGRDARWVAPEAFSRTEKRARTVLDQYFKANRLAESLSKAELQSRLLPPHARGMGPVYLDWLKKKRVIDIEDNQVRLPGRSAELTRSESELTKQLLSRFEAAGLAPPPASEMASQLGAKPQIVEGVVRHLIDTGALTRLPGGLIIAAKALANVRAELEQAGMQQFSVGDFKDRFGLTRKWAIPILEHLDSAGITRRVGNERQLVKPV